MHRAPIGDLTQSGPLLAVEVALQVQDPGENVDPGPLGMVDLDADPSEGPAFAFGVHAHGHPGARPEGDAQVVVGIRAEIVTADGFGFIGDEFVAADRDVIGVPAPTGLGHGDPRGVTHIRDGTSA